MENIEELKKNKSLPILILVAILIMQFVIYVPHVGTGFIKDDFTWLGNVVVDGQVDYIKPFKISTGFYRPLVSLTFGIQYQLHGMNPKPFGLFNLFLHMINILLIYAILSRNKETHRFALLATVLFAFNAKSNRMAIGWISSRTTLLFSFFVLLTLFMYLKVQENKIKNNRNPVKNGFLYFLIGISFLAALLSKETAMGLPLFVFLFTFFIIGKRNGLKKSLEKLKVSGQSLLVFIFPLIVYFCLRFSSNAFTPLNAPEIYRYTFSPIVLLKNISEYIIRGGLLALIIFLFFLAAMPFITRRTSEKQKIPYLPLVSGILWFFVFLLPSLFLPIRSDLYAYFPQVGLHIILFVSIFLVYKNRKIKKPEYLTNMFIPVCLIGFIWIGYLFVEAKEIGKRGKNSALFSKQLTATISTVHVKKRLCVVDRDTGKKFTPSKTVSYGFHSMLNLYYPKQNLMGFIVPYKKNITLKRRGNMSYFIWENNRLDGPFGYRKFKRLIGAN